MRGRWSDADAEQCPATHQPFALNAYVTASTSMKYRTERCLLTEQHEGKHFVDEFTTWTDETAVNGRGPEVAP